MIVSVSIQSSSFLVVITEVHISPWCLSDFVVCAYPVDSCSAEHSRVSRSFALEDAKCGQEVEDQEGKEDEPATVSANRNRLGTYSP
jgi:hypothetical protein